jgi:hypothetical protein
LRLIILTNRRSFVDSKQIWPLVRDRLRVYLGSSWDIEGLCKAIGVSDTTVGDWLVDKQPAVGVRLIRLWHYLAAVGFDSPELDQLRPFNRYAGQLLAMSIFTLDDLEVYFGVRSSQTVLQILRGQPPQKSEVTLESLQRDHDKALQTNLAKLPRFTSKQQMVKAEVVTAPPQPPPEPIPPRRTSKPSSGGRDYALEAASALSSVLPLVRWLNSDECTAAQRSRFRELIGGEALFELSNTIGALCGERARKQAR